MKRITGKHPDECPACHGIGYGAASAPEMVQGTDGLVTTAQGSGCLRCGGTGRLGSLDCVPFVLPKRFFDERTLS